MDDQQTHVNYHDAGDNHGENDRADANGDGDAGDAGAHHNANIFSPDVPSEKRVRRWAVNLENIIMDPLGVEVTVSIWSLSQSPSAGAVFFSEEGILPRESPILAFRSRAQERTGKRAENQEKSQRNLRVSKISSKSKQSKIFTIE